MNEETNQATTSQDFDLIAFGEKVMKSRNSLTSIASAETLITISDSMRLFSISANGFVSLSPDFSPVNIVKFVDEPLKVGEDPHVFLHIGDWVYPLIPGVSPGLRTNSGAYIFPDFTTAKFVALMFLQSLSDEIRQRFEGLIMTFTVLLEQISGNFESEFKEQRRSLVESFSNELQDVATLLSHKVEKGVESVEQRLRSESKLLQEKSKEFMDDRVLKGIEYAKEVSDTTVKVSGVVVHKLAEISVAIAKKMAPHIKQGFDSMPPTWKQSTSNVAKLFNVETRKSEGYFGTGNTDEVFLGLNAAAFALEKYLASEAEHAFTHG